MSGCCCPCSDTVRRFVAVLLRGVNTVVNSPWIDRQGEYLRATADLVSNASLGLEVHLFTKNKDETGNGVEVDSGTTVSLSAPGRQTTEWSSQTGIGLKELVRYRFRTFSTTTPPSPKAWVVLRMLAPVWFCAVRTVDLP